MLIKKFEEIAKKRNAILHMLKQVKNTKMPF